MLFKMLLKLFSNLIPMPDYNREDQRSKLFKKTNKKTTPFLSCITASTHYIVIMMYQKLGKYFVVFRDISDIYNSEFYESRWNKMRKAQSKSVTGYWHHFLLCVFVCVCLDLGVHTCGHACPIASGQTAAYWQHRVSIPLARMLGERLMDVLDTWSL